MEYPATVIARIGEAGDLMVDATSSQAFQRILLDLVTESRTLAGRMGRLVPNKSTLLAEVLKSGPPQVSRILKVEQSNSSIIYDDKIYLKLFRKLEEGINPDLELTKQLSDKCGFPYVPTYLGDIQYVLPGQEPASLVMLQAFTPSEQDGWSHTLGAVGRYFDRVLAEPQLPPPPTVGLWQEIPQPLLSVIEGVHLETVRQLGERTAEMHAALAQDTESPDFAPEAFSLQHQRSVFQSIRSETKQTLALLTRCAGVLEESPKALAENVLRRAGRIGDLSTITCFATRSTPRKFESMEITTWVRFCSPAKTS